MGATGSGVKDRVGFLDTLGIHLVKLRGDVLVVGAFPCAHRNEVVACEETLEDRLDRGWTTTLSPSTQNATASPGSMPSSSRIALGITT